MVGLHQANLHVFLSPSPWIGPPENVDLHCTASLFVHMPFVGFALSVYWFSLSTWCSRRLVRHFSYKHDHSTVALDNVPEKTRFSDEPEFQVYERTLGSICFLFGFPMIWWQFSLKRGMLGRTAADKLHSQFELRWTSLCWKFICVR